MPDPCADLAATYHRQGYAVLPGLLDSATCADAITRIEAIQTGIAGLAPDLAAMLVLERTLPARKRGGIPPEATGDAIFIIGDPPAFDRGFLPLVLHPTILGLVRHLLGTDDIRCHLSNVTMKRPGIGSGISWHRDYPNRYICPAASTFLRTMICLDGMSAENGATGFVTGSHLLDDKAAREAGAVTDITGKPVDHVTCPPGSLVLIHPKVLHGGAPNHGPQQRRNFIVQWGRDDDPVTPPADAAESLCGLSPSEIAQCLPNMEKGAA